MNRKAFFVYDHFTYVTSIYVQYICTIYMYNIYVQYICTIVPFENFMKLSQIITNNIIIK